MDDGSIAATLDVSGKHGAAQQGPGTDIGADPASAASPMTGTRLKAAREALGLTIQDIAERTRITLRHVQAIEAGHYASLPGRPYALGFARSYARAVGLDDKAVADAVRRELDGSAPRPEPRVIHQFEVGDPDKTPSRLLSWLALLLVAAVFGMGVMFWRSYYWPSAELPPLVGTEPPKPIGVAPPRRAMQVPQPVVPVIFTALEDGVWVKFSDDAGLILLQKEMARGESWTVPTNAANPVVWTGRPDALAITVGGQPVPRLAEREGILKNVPVSAQALLARAQAGPATAPLASASLNRANRDAPSRDKVRRRPAMATPTVTASAATEIAVPSPAATVAEPPAASSTVRQ